MLTQYVRDVQQDKIRLIHQSLSATELKQSDVDGQRFKVYTDPDRNLIYKTCSDDAS